MKTTHKQNLIITMLACACALAASTASARNDSAFNSQLTLAANDGVSAVVSSGLAVGSEAFSANVDADAGRTAKKIATQLKKLFLTEGWIQM
jgi:hypothetical protein